MRRFGGLSAPRVINSALSGRACIEAFMALHQPPAKLIRLLISRDALAACVILLSLLSQGCGSNPASTVEPRRVRAARAAETELDASLRTAGALAPREEVTLNARVPGRLNEVTVEVGSTVRKGQVVAKIEEQEHRRRIRQAEAALRQARERFGLHPDGDDELILEESGAVRQARAQFDEARLNRDRALARAGEGAAARAEFDRADAAYKVALSRYQDAVEELRDRQAFLAARRTELSLARRALANTSVVASIDGIVREHRAIVGDQLSAGTPILTLARPNPLRFRAEVSEREAALIREGQEVRVTVEGEAGDYMGRIVSIGPVEDEHGRRLFVEAEINNPGEGLPGNAARAEIRVGEAQSAVAVPANALAGSAGAEKVFIVVDGRVQERAVVTGRRFEESVQIVSGLRAGDAVVLDPGDMQTGTPVNVVE